MFDRLRPLNIGEYRPQSTCTFSEFVQRVWLPDVRPTLKYSTKKHYEYIVKLHLVPVFGEMQLRLITREAAQSFLVGKLRGGLSWKTVKHIRTTFGTILGAAEMQGLISSNPIRKTKLPRRGPVAERAPISPEQIGQVLASLPAPACSLAWLLVLTGLRIGELLALRWCDIDLPRGQLRVGRACMREPSMTPRPSTASGPSRWVTSESRFSPLSRRRSPIREHWSLLLHAVRLSTAEIFSIVS